MLYRDSEKRRGRMAAELSSEKWPKPKKPTINHRREKTLVFFFFLSSIFSRWMGFFARHFQRGENLPQDDGMETKKVMLQSSLLVLLKLWREPDLLLSGEALQGLELTVQVLDLLTHATNVLLRKNNNESTSESTSVTSPSSPARGRGPRTPFPSRSLGPPSAPGASPGSWPRSHGSSTYGA